MKAVGMRDDEMVLETSAADPAAKENGGSKELLSEEASKSLTSITTNIVNELLVTDWSKVKSRVLRPPSLLKMLAELIRSYPTTSNLLVESAHEKKSLIHWIVDKFLLHSGAVAEPIESRWVADEVMETSLAAKALLSNLVASQSNSKVNEIVVGEVKSLLHTAINEHQKTSGGRRNKETAQPLCEKISSLAKLIMLLRESSQSSPNAPASTTRREMPKQCCLIRQMHKKNLVIDFTKVGHGFYGGTHITYSLL